MNLLQNFLPSEILKDAESAVSKLIPRKSKDRYLKEYELFQEWKKIRNVAVVTEDAILALFYQKSYTSHFESAATGTAIEYSEENALETPKISYLSSRCQYKFSNRSDTSDNGSASSTLPQKPVTSKVDGSGRKIIGGDPVSIADFPFMVSIQINNKHYCGGSYIKPLWILSAAHCMINTFLVDMPLLNPTIFTALMGSSNISSEENNPKGMQVRKVLMLYPHDSYSTTYKTNDVGLIKIERPFDFSSTTAFVKLPQSSGDGEYRHETCTTLGWGSTSEAGQEGDAAIAVASPILRSVQIPRITLPSCQLDYTIDFIVPRLVICAATKIGGKDACQGDSGGPLICHGVQVGIVSWGKGCGETNEPGVYTRVDNFLSWIDEVVEKSENGQM